MSNLVPKSGLDIFWRQGPVRLSQAHEAQNNRPPRFGAAIRPARGLAVIDLFCWKTRFAAPSVSALEIRPHRTAAVERYAREWWFISPCKTALPKSRTVFNRIDPFRTVVNDRYLEAGHRGDGRTAESLGTFLAELSQR